MIIKARNGVEIAIFTTDVDITIVIHPPNNAAPTVAEISPNHCQALELILTGARIEAEARGRGE